MPCALSRFLLPALLSCVLVFRSSGASAQQENYRPQYHFSPQEHWTNDPNGLLYFEGEYHLFFQYNPFGDKWGHMSWGHAVSGDLIHWQQLPVALAEENGVMIFTGSTVVDSRNTSGFCQNGKPCLVAIYTGHTPGLGGRTALQTQNIAYSNDRGRTWTKYKSNPVLDLHMSDFRDPKVLWSEASKQWVMAVALPNDHKVRFYGSPDLKSWKLVSDFGPAGAAGGQWECPELFELPIEQGNGSRWIMKVGLNPGGLQGGSGEQYFVGHFDGQQFVNENPASQTLWTDYGKDCYCALTFNNLPKSKPAVMLGWMDNWQYAADLPTSGWRGQMTVPRKLALRQTSEGLRLVQQPIDALQSLRAQRQTSAGTDLGPLNASLKRQPLAADHTFDIDLQLQLGSARTAGLRLRSSNGSTAVFGFEQASQTFYFDRTQSGTVNFNKDFPTRVTAPLRLTGHTLQLRILGDRNSLEVFADNGRIAMTNLVFAPPGPQQMEIFADGGSIGPSSVSSWALQPGR